MSARLQRSTTADIIQKTRNEMKQDNPSAFTQEAMADKLGIGVRQYKNFEAGDVTISWKHINKLCEKNTEIFLCLYIRLALDLNV